MMLPQIHNASHTGVYVVETFMSVFIKVAIRFIKEIFKFLAFFCKGRYLSQEMQSWQVLWRLSRYACLII